VTRQIARLAARDEARHVAFGMAHLMSRLKQEPQLLTRLSNAVQSRNDALSGTSGLNEEVFDALILLAAGEFTPETTTAEHFAATINQLKGTVTMLFITHAMPKNLLVDEVVRIGHGMLSAVSDAHDETR
jgi:hypothetical protein